MPLSFDLFSPIWKTIGEMNTAGALAVHVGILKDQLKSAQAQVVELEKQNAELVKRAESAERQVAAHAKTTEYVEHLGVLWKPDGRGGYAAHPVCPTCHVAMTALELFMPFRCHKCRFLSPFKGEDLVRVMSEIPSTTPPG